jgi:PAS domain S-box-containing protein
MADFPSDSSPEPLSPPLKLSAQEALSLLSGTSLGQFFQCVPATVWMTDRSLTLTFVQGVLLRTLEISPEKLLGRTLPDLLLDGREDHPIIQGHLTALAGHETSVRIEWGGNLYNARIAPLRDQTGAIIGCAGSHQQIGWLPDDEGLLRESDARLHRIIDSNMIGIVFGNDEGQITEANEAFLHLAGYTREDLVADGISWPALTPVDCHARQLAAIDEVRQTGRCTPFEVRLIRKDGSEVPVLVGGARLSARRREGVAFVLDISDRHRVRRQLTAELACADALLADAPPEAAVGRALLAVRDALKFTSLEWWERPVAGPASRHATTWPESPDDSAELVERALDTGVPQRAHRWACLAVPIGAGSEPADCAVVVFGSAALESDLVDALGAVGKRLQAFRRRTAR